MIMRLKGSGAVTTLRIMRQSPEAYEILLDLTTGMEPPR
jgi:hypothetical protein